MKPSVEPRQTPHEEPEVAKSAFSVTLPGEVPHEQPHHHHLASPTELHHMTQPQGAVASLDRPVTVRG
jgi:hypothetical protein